jgi:flavodoxin
MLRMMILLCVYVFLLIGEQQYIPFEDSRSAQAETASKNVMIVYHGGIPPWRKAPDLDEKTVDALTQATTERVNVAVIASGIDTRLKEMGFRVRLINALDISGPGDFLGYDGIIFGSPTWFSNVSYPVKKLFDEYLIRIYENHAGKLNDTVLAGFTTFMDKKSGPECLTTLNNGLRHLSKQIAEGLLIDTGESETDIRKKIHQFCDRFSSAMKN